MCEPFMVKPSAKVSYSLLLSEEYHLKYIRNTLTTMC